MHLSVFAPGHCLVLNLASKVIKKYRPKSKRGVRYDLLKGKGRFSQGSRRRLGHPKGLRVSWKVAIRLVLVLIAHQT